MNKTERKLDDDLIVALDKCGWNSDAVEAALTAQRFRDNPPAVLTAEDCLNAVWATNSVKADTWRDPLSDRWHTKIEGKEATVTVTVEMLDYLCLGEQSMLAKYWDECRKAIRTINGHYVSPDFDALLAAKRQSGKVTIPRNEDS